MAEKLNVYELDKFNPNDFFIPLTFSVADFRDISTRNGNFSKTIEIPSTKKNDSLLGHSFDISVEGFFDRNKKQPAFLERDGITYLDGFMQLKSVELKNGKPYKYKIVLYSSLSEWASLIDGSIRSLIYPTVDFNSATILTSWFNNGLDDDYVFPLINYGNLSGKTSTDNVLVGDILPACFVYPILRKIFKEVGYELKPGVFLDKQFHNLILPVTQGDVTSSRDYLDTQGGGTESRQIQGVTGNSPVDFVWFERFKTANSQNNFIITSSTQTTSFKAPFDCVVSGSCFIKISNEQALFDNDVTVKMLRYDPTFTAVLTELDSVQKTIRKRGSKDFYLSFDSASLNSGDIVAVQFTSSNSKTMLYLKNGSFDIYINSTSGLQSGDKVGVGDYLPDIKKIDLVKAVVQMFNLYHITDERQKTVEFITRDDYYKRISDSDDWTGKVDYSKPIEIEQLDDKLNKELEFNYSDDEDDGLLSQFVDRNGYTLGDYTEELENEFLKGSKKVANLPFAPTFASGGLDQPSGETIPIPWIPTNFNTGLDKLQLKPRILVYGGMIEKEFKFEGASQDRMPFCWFNKKDSGFKDLSLSFRSFSEFNTTIRQSDVGLFERFYKNQVKMFNNSRLVTMYLKLNPVDILNLDFRKPKLINGNYYYLNKIEDYKTGTEETVKVELINIP